MPKCSRLVHYKCSQLPAYQVQIHLNNQNQKKSTRTKLTFICCNCVEVSKDLPSLCQENNENTIRQRDRAVEECQTLTTKAKDWKIKYDNLKNQNIETRTINDLDKKFQEQMKTLGESIKSSILEEIKSSLTKVEEQVTDAKKSYAEAVDTNATKANQPCIKEFVREARNFELTESTDRKRRQANLIIHGVKENNDPGEDQGYVDDLIKFVKAQSKTKHVSRIGVHKDDKSRPIKVVFQSEKQKDNFYGNLSALKDIDEYKGISITEDLTPSQRAIYKKLAADARENNKNESDGFWRVVGNSKNGWDMIKFKKRSA